MYLKKARPAKDNTAPAPGCRGSNIGIFIGYTTTHANAICHSNIQYFDNDNARTQLQLKNITHWHHRRNDAHHTYTHTLSTFIAGEKKNYMCATSINLNA